MSVTYITQDRIAESARAIVDGARVSLDIASPWIEQDPVLGLLGSALARSGDRKLQVRLIYRLREPSDLSITDLGALAQLAGQGVSIRHSPRLHAKMIIADRTRALVGSQNLTGRGGYGYGSEPLARNEEAGVLVDAEQAAEDAQAHFDQIWQQARELSSHLCGVVIGFPTVREFRFIAVDRVSCGQLVTAPSSSGASVVGEITELTAHNPSFPQMTEQLYLAPGVDSSAPRRVRVSDLPTLFSHPIKEHGYLLAKTLLRSDSAFCIAKVRVLRELGAREPTAPGVPISLGSDVCLAEPSTLRRLLGDGQALLGRMAHHPDVGVWVKAQAIVGQHLAILGMTGSGKSNAVKQLVRELCHALSLRVLVIDTHGEYGQFASELSSPSQRIDVSIPDKINLLDFEMVKDHFSIVRMTSRIKNGLRKAADKTADPQRFAKVLEASGDDTLAGIASEVADNPDGFCIGETKPRLVASDTTMEIDLEDPGTYVLDLNQTMNFEVRAKKCAVAARRAFETARASQSATQTLVVVDEAHNYAPERTTGYMQKAAQQGSLGELTSIAVEGRKFGVGLVLVSQRPSRVAKDVLAQMNSQLVFRLANAEDLAYVRESFEATSEDLLADLPHLDTGVCICSGTMLALPAACRVPLYGPRHSLALSSDPLAESEGELRRAIEAALPGPTVLLDSGDVVVVAASDATVSIRGGENRATIDVDCLDPSVVARLRTSLADKLTADQPAALSGSGAHSDPDDGRSTRAD